MTATRSLEGIGAEAIKDEVEVQGGMGTEDRERREG